MLSDLVLPLGFQKCTAIQQLNLKNRFIFDLGIALSGFRHIIDNGAVLWYLQQLSCLSNIDLLAPVLRKPPRSFGQGLQVWKGYKGRVHPSKVSSTGIKC